MRERTAQHPPSEAGSRNPPRGTDQPDQHHAARSITPDHDLRPSPKAGVAGSNPAGGTRRTSGNSMEGPGRSMSPPGPHCCRYTLPTFSLQSRYEVPCTRDLPNDQGVVAGQPSRTQKRAPPPGSGGGALSAGFRPQGKREQNPTRLCAYPRDNDHSRRGLHGPTPYSR
jgi:hypothetical protein